MEKPAPEDAVMVGRRKTPSRQPARPQPSLFLGEWIRALGKSQKDVATAAGMSEAYLSQLISGRRTNPSAGALLDIAKYLGIPLQSLYQPPPDREFLDQARQLDPALLNRLVGSKH